MALVVGTDTYVTLAAADAYALARAWTAWASATDEVKEAALRTAATYLDQSYEWNGSISDIEQVQAWPRMEVTDREGRELASDAVPSAVENAQIELAYIGLSAALVTNEAQGDVKRVKADTVEVEFMHGQRVSEGDRFRWVDRLLAGLFISRVGGGAFTRRMIKT